MFKLVSEKRYKELEKECQDLRNKVYDLQKNSIENQELKTKLSNIEKELADAKKQIREQTEADLFFISAKIQKKLLDGEPKENIHDLIRQQNLYQSQLAQAQQQSYSPFLQGLGLGGLFNGILR